MMKLAIKINIKFKTFQSYPETADNNKKKNESSSEDIPQTL